jgi:hypothetical protein
VTSILVPALVSAVVALGIEWIAKPTLEVRKERILAAARARREAYRLTWEIMNVATPLLDAMEDGGGDPREVALRQELATLLGKYVEHLYSVHPRIFSKGQDVVTRYQHEFSTFLRSRDLSSGQLKNISTLLTGASIICFRLAPWWRPLKRRRQCKFAIGYVSTYRQAVGGEGTISARPDDPLEPSRQ